MKLKNYIIALLLIGMAWSCSDDDEVYTPEKPTTGEVFTVRVGVETTTVDQFGGEDVVRSMLYTNFDLLSNQFNKSGEFNEMHFFMDEFYTFEGTSKSQVESAHPNHDIALVINGNREIDDIEDGYYNAHGAISLSDNSISMSRLFAHAGIKYFTYAMGLGRGAIDLSEGDVLVADNPIAAREYIAPGAVMNFANPTDDWNEVSVKLIKQSESGTPSPIENILPNSLVLNIKNLTGTIIPDVNVSIYGVLPGSGSVMEEPLLVGKTDELGSITFSNPYDVPSSVETTDDLFANLFIKIEKFNVENYFFMPISEMLLAGVNGNTSNYTKEYAFDLTTLEDMRVTRFTFDNQGDLMSNEGTIGVTTNVAHTTDSKIGSGAIQFDGSQHLVLNKNDQINAGSSYTVAYWFKTSNDSGGQNAFWTMSSFSGDLTNDPWVPGGLTVRYTADNVSYDVGWEGGASGSASVVDGQWHHLVTTVEFVSADRADIKMFIDGTLVMSGNNSLKLPYWGQYWDGWTGEANLDDFVVKIGISSTNWDAAVPFTGVIDDLQIFNEALDNNWVYELYQQQ